MHHMNYAVSLVVEIFETQTTLKVYSSYFKEYKNKETLPVILFGNNNMKEQRSLFLVGNIKQI